MSRSSAGIVIALLSALLVGALTLAESAHAQGYNDDSIGRANLDGSGVQQGFITGLYGPTGIAVDAGHVYWTNGYPMDSIGRADLDGSGIDQAYIGDTTGTSLGAADVAVNTDHVYWTNPYSEPSIGRANLDATGAAQSFIPMDASPPYALAVDTGHVYWTSGPYGAATIARANLDGTGVEPHFIDLASPSPAYDLAVDAGHIYWTNAEGRDASTVARANLDGSGVEEDFIPVRSSPLSLAVDAGHVYSENRNYGRSGSSSIGRANLDGSGVDQDFIVIDAPASGSSYLTDLAADAGHVYWVNYYTPPTPPPGAAYDYFPPDTLLTDGPPFKTHKTTVRFWFTSDESGSTFECRVDRKRWRSCSSPKTIRHLEPGKHWFRMRAIDPSGNIDATPARDAFRVLPRRQR